jgi:pimeloyl-ACP methyl ester carboxylesterase
VRSGDPTRVEALDAHAPGVVLLHGIGCSSRSLGKLQRALQQAGFATLNLDYPSRRKPLDLLAGHIHPAVADFAERNTAPIHFVGHSMGGLLVRVYIANYRPARLGRVVMLGTPNAGSEVADLLRAISLYRSFFGPAGLQLTTDLDDMLKSLPALDYAVGIVAGNRSIDPISSTFILPRPNDGRVSVASSKLDGMADHITIKAFHAGLPRHRIAIDQTIAFLREGRFNAVSPGRRGWNMRTIPDSIFKQHRAKRLKSPRPALRGERSKFAASKFRVRGFLRAHGLWGEPLTIADAAHRRFSIKNASPRKEERGEGDERAGPV